jgi:hypothetical protein
MFGCFALPTQQINIPLIDFWQRHEYFSSSLCSDRLYGLPNPMDTKGSFPRDTVPEE